jgi:hypothetical protein
MAVPVRYYIHENPSNSSSAVVFQIGLSLKEINRNGADVAWKIELLKLTQPQSGGGAKVWTKSDPPVPTSDGLWWVTHDDPDQPTRDEFALPPHLQGTAQAENPSDANMKYDFEGKPFSGMPPWPVTAALDYVFTLVGNSTPEEEGDDEPSEVPDEDDPI